MRWRVAVVLCLSGLMGLAVAGCRPRPAAKVVGYFASWSVYARDFHVPDIAADQLTHVVYAFAAISPGGGCDLADPWADVQKPYPGDVPGSPIQGSFGQLLRLKQDHPHVRTLLSVGGWTGSARFSDVALSAASREAFARSCVGFMAQYGFDGLDVDWEYPVAGGAPGNVQRPEDRGHFTLLLEALRSELDAAGAATGRRYLLTAATPACPWLLANFELDRIHEHVDWLHLMTYDFTGPWSAETGFNAPLHPASDDPAGPSAPGASATVADYLAAGVPPRKMVLGVPFYGRGFAGVPDVDAGLYQPFTGLPAGTWEPGVFDFWDLAERYVGVLPGYWDPEAQVPWLYDPTGGVFISYDDTTSIAAKADYARRSGLGGVVAWELSGDDASATLLSTIRAAL